MAELIFSFTVEDYIPPFLRNDTPADGTTSIGPTQLISVDILDDDAINLTTLDAYVNGSLVYNGVTGFVSPYDGPQSAISATTVDGYPGYHLVLDNTGYFDSTTNYTTLISVQDAYGNSLSDSFTFTTRSITTLSSLDTGLYEITLDLTFSTDILQNSALTNPANYYFTGNMYARKVEIIASNKVRLWVELFYGQSIFSLTVDDGIKNIDGYSIEESSVSLTPFSSDATFTNFNGRVRTWHESNIVHGDSQRIYLAGIRGIDVFRKTSATGFAKWAQIFDAYGIDAMYVANYEGDLEISDSISPYLVDQSPAPSSYALANTHISFKVADATTAVEITTMRIYVNNNLVFGGSGGGWQTGWSGIIEIGYQQLLVEVWPDTNFNSGTTVTVRVMAEDILGNQMDSSYSFIIYVPVGGFGGVPFGTSPFGGV